MIFEARVRFIYLQDIAFDSLEERTTGGEESSCYLSKGRRERDRETERGEDEAVETDT